MHPVLHLQSYPPTRDWQIELTPQGLDKQWFLSLAHSILGFPMNPLGHEQSFTWRRVLHWALTPQALGRAHGLMQDPSLHCLLDSQSPSCVHSTRLHSIAGFPCRPWGQIQTALWLETRHSAEAAHPLDGPVQGSEH